jgi:hypothetical protein
LSLGLGLAPRAEAQGSASFQAGAHGVLAFTQADPIPGNRSLGELRLVQPVIMLHASGLSEQLKFLGTLNLEGLTIPNGELTLGDWGEGFMDRRHPHTYAHELILAFQQTLATARWPVRMSLVAGKGFAPFGTDDPMSRPILRYPVNHHWAQILERAVGILGLRAGPVLLEGALFNGDEPEKPSQWPVVSRFGDSWSGRLTLLPVGGLELQGSHASVNSPEHRGGAGTDQSKWSVSGRWSRPVERVPVYGLVEWARTSEADGFFIFESFLAESALDWGRHRLYYRFERTDRPEEERTSDPFRSRRPHFENSILGTTRWTVHTAGYAFHLDYSPARLDLWPLVELSTGIIHRVNGLFDPQVFYGKESFWSLTLGLRLGLGMPMHRMGRYGVAQDTAPEMEMEHHAHHD